MLKVMTFNIRYGSAPDGENAWPKRKTLTYRAIREQDPDILGVQECLKGQLDELLFEFEHFAAVGVGREDGEHEGEYSAILYRRTMPLASATTFWLSETPDVPGSKSWGAANVRICTVAEFEDFTVFNCHLDHVSDLQRRNGLAMIRSRMHRRAILTGDFNMSESDPALKALDGLQDTFRQVHPDLPEPDTFTGFEPVFGPGEKIDYIYCTPDIEVRSADVVNTIYDGRCASDHFPVVATLDL